LQDPLVTVIKQQGEVIFALHLHHAVGLITGSFSFSLQSLLQELGSVY